MVLPLKRWKSRTSPGIVAGVGGDFGKPIHMLKGGFWPPFAVSAGAQLRPVGGWRGMEQPGSSSGS
jgi:hypothetical protein